MQRKKTTERFEQIYKLFTPLRQVKSKTIHVLGQIGRKHPILRYPIFLFLVVFIFIYNLNLYFFMYLKLKEKLAKGLAFAMTVVLVFTSTNFLVFAEDNSRILGCGKEEHVHDVSCYQMELSCGVEESEEHVHWDPCYENILICDLEEHTHIEECYQKTNELDNTEYSAEETAAEETTTEETATEETATEEISPEENSEEEASEEEQSVYKQVVEPFPAPLPAADSITDTTEEEKQSINEKLREAIAEYGTSSEAEETQFTLNNAFIGYTMQELTDTVGVYGDFYVTDKATGNPVTSGASYDKENGVLTVTDSGYKVAMKSGIFTTTDRIVFNCGISGGSHTGIYLENINIQTDKGAAYENQAGYSDTYILGDCVFVGTNGIQINSGGGNFLVGSGTESASLLMKGIGEYGFYCMSTIGFWNNGNAVIIIGSSCAVNVANTSWLDTTNSNMQAGENADNLTGGYNFGTVNNNYKYVTILPDASHFTTHNINYNANGGSGSMSAGTVVDGRSFTIPNCSFTKSDAEFLGWTMDGTEGTVYKIGEIIQNINKSITLYAKWSEPALPTVTVVDITPSSASVIKGNTENFAASVTGTNNPDQTVSWSVTGNSSPSTSISATGVLTVAIEETATQLTVQATSTVDVTKSGTATVTLVNPTYTIEVDTSTLDFGTEAVGYTNQPAVQTVTVMNTGNTSITLTQPASADYVIGNLSARSLAPNATATFTIQPELNLSAGNYNKTITVRTGNSTSVTVNVIFHVSPAAPTGLIPGKPSDVGSVDGKISGTTAQMEYSTTSEFTAATTQDCTGSEITGLAAGTYFIRVKANNGVAASTYVAIVLEDGKHTYATGWSYDDTNHWHAATCAHTDLKEDVEVHTFTNYTYNNDATYFVDGTEIGTCECGATNTRLKAGTKLTDSVHPNVTVTIKTKSWVNLLNIITFGNFFKETQEIQVIASDNESGLDTVQYYVSGTSLSEEEVKALQAGDWKNYNNDSRPTLNKGKYFVYGKVTDNFGNATYVGTDGIVIYKDSKQNTVDVSYVKNVTGDVTANVTLNGNTVAAISDGSKTLTVDTDYTVDAVGKITFKESYLKTLAASSTAYIMTISYNPMGEAYTNSTENESPIATTIALTVRNPKLNSITVPTARAGVANGTIKTVAALGLPTEVAINTEDASITTANVTWNLDNIVSGSYDTDVLTEQTFIVNGTVTLPDGIDADGKSLVTIIQVTVSAAGIVRTPTVNPVAGTYTENQSVTLSTSTDGATIYYTTDGSTPTTSSTKYTGSISITGTAGQNTSTTIKAIAVKDGMQDSFVFETAYTIIIPAPKYTVNVTDGTGSGDYEAGTTVVITANAPSTGKQFKNWSIESGSVTLNNANSSNTTFTMPAGAVTVQAKYEDIPVTTHTITATAGANGSISPSGAVSINDGDNQAFTITANEGFEIDSLKVDGSDVAVSTSYIFSNVITDHTIAVTFKAKNQIPVTSYDIIVQGGDNGTAYANIAKAAAGTKVTLTANPNDGYEFKEWQVVSGGVTITENSFTMPANTVTVKAVFSKKIVNDSIDNTVKYKIIDGANGTWTEGTDGILTIRGDGELSKFVSVKVDGNVIGSDNYTVTSGSTIITLKKSYMDSISEGSHTFEIVWTDGSASTLFTVKALSTDNNNNGNDSSNSNTNSTTGTKSPQTGDTSQTFLWVLILLVSGMGIGTMAVRKLGRKED